MANPRTSNIANCGSLSMLKTIFRSGYRAFYNVTNDFN